jgi:hypothetical protein
MVLQADTVRTTADIAVAQVFLEGWILPRPATTEGTLIPNAESW